MTVEELRELALALPGTTEDIKWGEHLCFSVGGKLFLITSPDTFPPTAAFKVPEAIFEETISKEGFTRQKHLGRYHWINLEDISYLSPKEWITSINQSYELVVARLSKKQKKELNLAK